MKNVMIFVACHLLPVILFSQINDDAQKYAATITRIDLEKHLTIIAGPQMEGRETGTAGQRKAAEYIESQFKLMGLLPPQQLQGYQQTYPLYKDTLFNVSLTIGAKEYEFGKDFIVSLPAAQTREIKSGEIVFVGYGITDLNYDDYKGKDVNGKIIVFFSGEPKTGTKYLVTGTKESSPWGYAGTARKVELARQNGAVGAFIINPLMDSIPGGLIEPAKSSKVYFPRSEVVENDKLNYATIVPSVAKNIFGEALFNTIFAKARGTEPLNTLKAEINLETRFNYQKNKISYYPTNVIGYVEGTDKKDEYVFLTAHYDHLGIKGNQIYYGADDDGSGTVGVIEMAQAFATAKSEGKGPRRTVVFMTVSGEEKGLWGSEYYAEHPVFPLDKTTVDLNTDMVGRIDTRRKTADSTNYIYVIGHDKLSSDLPEINEAANKTYTGLTLDYKFDDPSDNERIYYRSDHYNFAKKGVPVLFFYDGMLKADYHKPTDTVDKINWALYQKRVHLIFHTAWEMANRDTMLKRDIEMVP